MTHTATYVPGWRDRPDARWTVKLDISELDSAGVEEFDPTTEGDVNRNHDYPILEHTELETVAVLSWEDESVHISWDHVDSELKVKNLDDGTDVANNTEVGEVIVEVIGK